MSRLKVDNIETRSGNNVSMDDPLKLKTYTTTQRDALSSPQAGDTIYNSTTGTIDFYNGTAWFATSATTYVTAVDYLVVAGGGGTGYYYGGGGGAGGLRSTVGNTGGGGTLETALTVTDGNTVTVTIGAGGSNSAGQGTDSVFSSITSIGGGGGGRTSPNTTADNGGSGGGGSYGTTPGGSGTTNQGYAGGTASSQSASQRATSAGGGGAGAVGQNSPNYDHGGDGGIGVICNILSASNANTRSVGEVDGSNVYYAGGGGGTNGDQSTGNPGDGGKGGGGDGFDNTNDGTNYASYDSGDANTGGGGGGVPGAGTTGGSGVVILKYPNTKTISVGAGLTSTTDTEGSNKITVFTAGTGNVSWS